MTNHATPHSSPLHVFCPFGLSSRSHLVSYSSISATTTTNSSKYHHLSSLLSPILAIKSGPDFSGTNPAHRLAPLKLPITAKAPIRTSQPFPRSTSKPYSSVCKLSIPARATVRFLVAISSRLLSHQRLPHSTPRAPSTRLVAAFVRSILDDVWHASVRHNDEWNGR